MNLLKSVPFEDEEIFVTRFSNDDGKVAVGIGNGDVVIMNTLATDSRKVFNTFENTPTTSIRWIDNHNLVAGNAGGWMVDYDCIKRNLFISKTLRKGQVPSAGGRQPDPLHGLHPDLPTSDHCRKRHERKSNLANKK